MKSIIKFFSGIVRENSRRYLLGFQVAALTVLVLAAFVGVNTGIFFSIAAVAGVAIWKALRNENTGVIFSFYDILVMYAGAANCWL
ncbi:MAG: hypothetical protein LUF04_16280 [Bacteroides sp.]|nr:hypothetical protein [Bacteroides sp.]